MADKDEEKQPDKKQEKPERLEKEQGKSEHHYDYRKSGWLLPVMIFVVVISLAGMFGSMVAYHHERQNTVLSPRLGGMRSGIIQRNRTSDGFGMMNSNSQNAVSGVVTNVNGSSFTVAGNGSTQQVSTDGSTQYQSGNQVKVNDTVVVYGTTTNNTLTATQIIINP